MEWFSGILFDQLKSIVVAPAIAAMLTFAMLKFTSIGKRLWKYVATDSGSQLIFSISIFATSCSIFAIISIYLIDQKIVVEQKRIGVSGVEGKVPEPGIFTGSDQWQAVAFASGSQICTISNLHVHAPLHVRPDGNSCQLHREGDKPDWWVKVGGSMQCRVTCYELKLRR